MKAQLHVNQLEAFVRWAEKNGYKRAERRSREEVFRLFLLREIPPFIFRRLDEWIVGNAGAERLIAQFLQEREKKTA